MAIKILLASSLLAFALATGPSLADDPKVGVMNFTFDAAHRDRLVQTVIYYPGAGGGYREWIGDNVVFKGVSVWRDAKPERIKHPLIVVSHGSGGNAANLAWLAERLAAQGFVVAIPNHQGSTSADSTPETTIPATWERPADMTALVDALASSPALSAIIDTQDISALGFSLGGQTVLALAGVRYRAAALASYCDENKTAMGCVWLDKGNPLIPGHVDLNSIDSARYESGHKDTRFRRIIAIDPAFVPAIDQQSLAQVDVGLQIINLGDGESIPSGVKADKIAAAVPGARYDTVADSNHFDFLGACKRFGWFYIWMEGDDPVCTESGNRSRDAIHDEIADKVLDFLKPDQS